MRESKAPNPNRVCPQCGGAKGFYALSCRSCNTGPWIKHGLSRTAEYRVWQTMRHRCTQDTSPAWADYGGRGITVCAHWINSPANFIADMGPRPRGRELDRKENGGGYWCGHCDECRALGRMSNCHWVTRKINDRNRRSNVVLEYKGEQRVLAELAETFGISADTLKWRLKIGQDLETALTTPVKRKASKRQGNRAA